MRTQRFRFEILCGISVHVIDGLMADLAFCHPGIADVIQIDPEKCIIEIRIRGDLTEDMQDDLKKQVSNVVESSVKSYRFIEEVAPVWTHESDTPYSGTDALETFTKKYVVTLGPGQYAFQGPASELYEFFCRRIQKLAEDMGSEIWHLPSIEMSHDLITKTGYFFLHPQLVTFGYRLPPHYERIRLFADDAKRKNLSGAEDSHTLEPTGFILEPVVCHNVYRSLKDHNLEEGKIITAQGRCYRYEGFRFSPLLRQWEYSMREVVLVGKHDFLLSARQRCIEMTQALIDELDLTASLEAATDPFFANAAESARTFQIMQEAKVELRLRIDDEQSTAAASFNNHGQHFTQPMNIRSTDGEFLETSCVGWGIERWMAAFVARWSEDRTKWPDFITFTP